MARLPPAAAERRLSFPDAELRQTWLPTLLDAYAVIDAGVAEGVRREQAGGRSLACGKGCSSCCRAHTTIPVYPLELVGISWYATEVLQEPLRERLRGQLRRFDELEGCPFLVAGICSIHPMRPIACRQFNVFGAVCGEGEDAYYTRREDVMTPIRRFGDEAFSIMLPFYGVVKKAARREAIKTGALHRLARVMRECDWKSLADRMGAFRSSSAVKRISRGL
jgi:Fe-S-cluster containining protein